MTAARVGNGREARPGRRQGTTPLAGAGPPFADSRPTFDVTRSSNLPTMDTAPLVIRDLAENFGPTRALSGVSLEVRRGELLGLLGPNGAGKTTLIRAVAGRVKPDAGAITLFGRPLGIDDPRPEVGVVPQELAIYPKLTATENLQVFGRLYGVTRRDLPDRVQWALKWSDLQSRAHEPSIRFSGGMKRRLNIACGLIHGPSLVLLDEPTVGVDPQSREHIYDMLAALRRDGVSIVLTTHHLEEAEQRCERILIIDAGRIIAQGSVAELVAGAVGAARQLTITLHQPLDPARALPPGLRLSADRLTVIGHLQDVGADVSGALAELAQAGGEVADLVITRATLQDAFIALTGRELRE